MIAFIVNNHQNNCEITRVTSVLYKSLKTKKHIFTKQILPLRVQNSPTTFPLLPSLGGSKVAFIIPTSQPGQN